MSIIVGRCSKYWSATPQGRAKSGSKGDPGVVPVPPPQDGSPGAPGTVDASPPELVELETVATWAYASLVLRQAELSYLSDDIEDASELLSWLVSLAEAGQPGVPIPARAALLAAAFGTDTNDTLGHIGDRAFALLGQMTACLDYFGQPKDFAPLVRFSTYQAQAQILFEHARHVDKALKEFDHTAITEADARRKLEGVVNDGHEQINKLEALSDQELAIVIELEGVAQRAIEDVDAQRVTVLNVDMDFRAAVERQAEECTFLDAVNGIGSVIAGAAALYSGVAGAAIAFGKAGKLARTTARTWANDKLIAKQLIDGGKNLASLKKAWKEIKDAIPDDPDIAKLVMGKEDVEAMTKPFLDLAEARDMRTQFERFLELTQLRNQQICEYTRAVAAHDGTLAQIASRKTEVERALVEMAVTTRRLNVDSIYAAVARYSFEIRSSLIKFLYQAHLSFRYWSLSRADFELTSDSLAALEAKDAAIRQNIIVAFEGLKSPRQRMVQPRVVSFTADEHPELIAEFRKTGRCTFSLSQRQVAEWGMRQIYIHSVGAKVHGVQTADNILKSVITHAGRSGFESPDGNFFEFQHARVRTAYHYDLRNDQPLTDGAICDPDARDPDSGIYWGVGAIADWTLSVLDATPREGGNNLRLDRSRVSRIDVWFLGKFAAPV